MSERFVKLRGNGIKGTGKGLFIVKHQWIVFVLSLHIYLHGGFEVQTLSNRTPWGDLIILQPVRCTTKTTFSTQTNKGGLAPATLIVTT